MSSFGRFRSTFGVVSTPKPSKSGYVIVMIQKKNYRIHRLMAYAFLLDKKPDETEIDHLDGNPSNNHIGNLEWVTHAENVRRSYLRNKARASNANRLVKPVRGRKVGEDGGEWTTYKGGATEAAKLLEATYPPRAPIRREGVLATTSLNLPSRPRRTHSRAKCGRM